MLLTKEYIESTLGKMKPFLADKYSVSKIGYFGSYAKNESEENSDIDILVEFSKPIGWDFFFLHDYLEKEFGKKIDLATPNALKPGMKEIILKEVKFI